MSVDTHIHLFTQMLPRAQSVRHDPSYDAPLAVLRACAAGTGVDRYVIVQPSFLGTDNTYLLSQLQAHAELVAGVAVLDRATPDEEIRHLARLGVRGIRLNLLGQPLARALDSATLDLVTRCAAQGLHIELHDDGARLPYVLDQVAPRAETIVIDHFGRPLAGQGGVESKAFRSLLRIGEGCDWYVKVSAPYRCPGVDIARAYRMFRQEWGVERLLWGSDWPWTQHESGRDYPGWVRPFEEGEDLPALLDVNAQRVYGFGRSEE